MHLTCDITKNVELLIEEQKERGGREGVCGKSKREEHNIERKRGHCDDAEISLNSV